MFGREVTSREAIRRVLVPADPAAPARNDDMLVSVPISDDQGLESAVNGHFGKAPSYLIFDTETGKSSVLDNRSDHMGGVDSPPDYMAKNGVSVVVCSGLGTKALTLLRSLDIDVFVGATGQAKDALAQWRSGTLSEARDENACKDHHH